MTTKQRPSCEPGGLLRLSEVLKRIPISKTTFLRYIKDGKFPAPKKIGVRVTAWLASDIQRLIDDLSTETKGNKTDTETQNTGGF